MYRYLVLFLPLLLPISLRAKRNLSNFWQDKNAIINVQTELTFELVNEIIGNEPPTTYNPSYARKGALYLLDQIFHDTRLDGSPIVSAFLDDRMRLVIDDLSVPLDSGMKVYKLYNDGWIVRTPQVTIGWDIYRGRKLADSDRCLMSDSIATALADACDILFLTHNHPDHVDRYVVNCFTKCGKPVIATEEILSDDKKVVHTRRDSVWNETFVAANGKTLETTILPGHQDHLQNNIYVVTNPDGYTVCSTGDQWLKEDKGMILSAGNYVKLVDVFMPICWAADLAAMCEAFGAKVVLTGHENELGHHSIDHREAYWLSYNKLEDFPIPNALMTWGECFNYVR